MEKKPACTHRCRIQIDTKNQIGQIANNGPDISTRHKLMYNYFLKLNSGQILVDYILTHYYLYGLHDYEHYMKIQDC